MILLIHPQEKRLVDILVQYAPLDTEQKRRNFLWIIGLDKFNSRMTPGSNKADHSIELIQILNHPSALTEDNQPAFYLFLRYLKDEVVPGHPEHVKFINELLNQSIGAPPSTDADITTVVIPPKNSNQDVTPPSVAPIEDPEVSRPKPPTLQDNSVIPPTTPLSQSKPPPQDDELRAEAERRAQQSAIWAVGGLAVLIIGLITAILRLGWEVMEPITYIFGLLLFLFGAAFFVITRIPFSIEAVYQWLVERELKRLRDERGDDDPSGGVSVEPTLLPSSPTKLQEIPDDPRTAELSFLEHRKNAKREFRHIDIDKYIPMEGTGEIRPMADEIAMDASFEHLPELEGFGEELREKFTQREPCTFKDIITAIKEVKRAVLLGEPGGGKTTTLRTLELHQIEAAKRDRSAPIPLYIKLNDWRDENEPLLDFMCRQMGAFGRELERLLSEKRAILLLDGFNEIPVNQRENKGVQIKRLFKAHPPLTTVLSCRALDYTLDLGFDRLNITPLTPHQIFDYAKRYFGIEKGERFFWQLAGGEDVNETWIAWQKVGATFALFWNANDIPKEFDFSLRYGTYADIWQTKVRQRHGSLLELAQNPYMLVMLATIYRSNSQLPANRGMLFGMFVGKLLLREGWATEKLISKEITLTEIGETLHKTLIELAYQMQGRRGKGRENSVVVALDLQEVDLNLRAQIDNGVRANILQKDNQTVRFSHQLLQEYFTALYMRDAVNFKYAFLKAEEIWELDNWWERQGWEEATVLWAGLSRDDFLQALEWVGDVNPEVAAQCIERSGAIIEQTLKANMVAKWQARWLIRLTDLQNEPNPSSRAGVGRALGLADLDTRRGVGLRKTDDLPDIWWCAVPDDGAVTIGGDKDAWGSMPETLVKPASFYIAKYPITYKQFQSFLDDPNGYENAVWWKDLAQRETLPGNQAYKFWNHPRERVSWYDAMAFCSWLTVRYQQVALVNLAGFLYNDHLQKILWEEIASGRYIVRLPTEAEWEKAACGREQRIYPYGNTFEAKNGNTVETQIGLTSAVGIFSHAVSPYYLEEMSGNVWEWTLTEWNSQRNDVLHSKTSRILRGGSWGSGQQDAHSASRNLLRPFNRYDYLGFRVVVGSIPHNSDLDTWQGETSARL